MLIEMSLRRGLLWLTINLALIIQCIPLYNFVFKFYISRKMFSVPPAICIPQFEHHCSSVSAEENYLRLHRKSNYVPVLPAHCISHCYRLSSVTVSTEHCHCCYCFRGGVGVRSKQMGTHLC
jgi:hypothetical protein